ncbi:MAG: hypothetical protein QOH71_4088 [Blastocatellia bacterium]|nr:hypothetical protein [Blastocatellia bacterium]
MSGADYVGGEKRGKANQDNFYSLERLRRIMPWQQREVNKLFIYGGPRPSNISCIRLAPLFFFAGFLATEEYSSF